MGHAGAAAAAGGAGVHAGAAQQAGGAVVEVGQARPGFHAPVAQQLLFDLPQEVFGIAAADVFFPQMLTQVSKSLLFSSLW